MRPEEEHAARFVEAVALGYVADLELAEEMRQLGIEPGDGSPLDAIAELEKPFVVGRADS